MDCAFDSDSDWLAWAIKVGASIGDIFYWTMAMLKYQLNPYSGSSVGREVMTV